MVCRSENLPRFDLPPPRTNVRASRVFPFLTMQRWRTGGKAFTGGILGA